VRLGVEAALIDGQLVPGDLEVLGGRVAGFGLSSPNGHGIAAPGFVDLR
jgi:N-acetylglucosamine-6-phosphate deacetylase